MQCGSEGSGFLVKFSLPPPQFIDSVVYVAMETS